MKKTGENSDMARPREDENRNSTIKKEQTKGVGE